MRKLLPMIGSHPGGRSALTCRFRCGDACFHEVPNTSANAYVGDVIASALSRRSVMRAAAVVSVAGAAGTAVTLGTAAPAAAATTAESAEAARSAAARSKNKAARGLRFTAVEPNTADTVTVPEGYEQNVVIRWGEPILRGAPAFDPENQTAKAQAGQFGYNNDFLALLPLQGERDRKLLVANHEYTDEILMFRGYDAANPTRDQVEVAWAAHGLSAVVVEENRRTGRLTAVPRHQLNRRVTATTEFRLTGPAAGSDLLKTSADPTGRKVLGTLNNCSGGTTPWGTTLHGEENFNQYFANSSRPTDKRYGVGTGATERKWERFDKRFDVAQEPNEVHRFGYVVEFDPYDPSSTPRKHTALGRFKHEAATIRLTSDGRPVVYSGDDERFDYFYKFVSGKRMKKGSSRSVREHNLSLLDEGTLYVARLTGDSPAIEIDGTGKLPADGEFDGAGEWIPLATATAKGAVSHVDGMTADEVFVFTRLAGDKVGATKMDRPEDIEPNPVTGKVYVALTNNSNRGVGSNAKADEANPRNANKHGQVLELTEHRNLPESTTFGWLLFLVAGDPEDPATYFAGFPKEHVSPISCPDNVAFDPHGNLWISTDGSQLGSHDGLFGVATRGKRRGELKQFLTVPSGAETCGPIIQDRRVLVAVQHPGELDGATVEKPKSTWPDGPGTYVRPAVVAVWRADGSDIGV
ncbi:MULTISPECIES: PhoX family protein [Streptomyces]|uniref:Secreted PhoX family phosphatase n=1 Tax=Streptomyces stelliscabiei TaxID=146820 RepID=A0A8I0P9L3_9ACTN|nr:MULTISPECIES: PhoX family protein [Streptomyces]KND44015.1 phosphatase [Streptomyces stelliscabiei]MBE1598651.1 secreted PhoX family phosphatase [Streptomyces stelliscabiei]MDX2516557.1 PhoX family protein [Streptomyces stelliscabiei]MDX2553561.1 PhoX family protein [Streptomyces stelliscabiei]MDX2613463.1 PhoX family protein [Streptomyces stelliscabiei]